MNERATLIMVAAIFLAAAKAGATLFGGSRARGNAVKRLVAKRSTVVIGGDLIRGESR